MKLIIKKSAIISFAIILNFTNIHAQPEPEIFTSNNNGCPPLSVSFSTNVTDSVSYHWIFGNGTTSNLANPVIMFDEPGDFDVALSIEFKNGKSISIDSNESIHITEKPSAKFELQNHSFCTGDSVHFINESQNASSYLWDFGDGTDSDMFNPTHIYEEEGKYSVALIAFNEAGCSVQQS